MGIGAFASIGSIAEGITFGKKKGVSMKARYFFIIFILLISGCKKQVGNASGDDANMLTEKQILEIANKAAISSDFYSEGMTPYYDVGNKRWDSIWAQFKKGNPADPSIKVYEKILVGRCYQAVLYKHDVPMIDGSFWLFVDNKTGEIIFLSWGL